MFILIYVYVSLFVWEFRVGIFGMLDKNIKSKKKSENSYHFLFGIAAGSSVKKV